MEHALHLRCAGRGLARTDVWAETALGIAIVAAAALLRFAALGDKSLWFDEAFALHAATRPLPEMLNLIVRGDTHPPLYYLLLSVWIRWFGTGEAALRSLGAILSTATVTGTWWLGRRLGGTTVGALAAFLLAVSAFHVQAAQEARMYPLLGLLTLASWIALQQALQGRAVRWAVYVLTTTLMLYTHYLALLNLIGQGVFVLIAAPRARQPWLVSQFAILVLFAPWLPVFFRALFLGAGAPFYRPPVGLGTITGVLGMLGFGGYAFGFEGYFLDPATAPWFQAVVVAPFVALLLLGFWWHRKREGAFALLVGYLMTPLVVALLISLRYNIVYIRYFSFLCPAFALTAAGGILALSAAVGTQARRTAILAGALVVLVLQAWVLDEYYSSPRLNRFNWRGAASLVAAGAGPEDVVVVTPGYTWLAFGYYFKGRQRVEFMTPRELLHVEVQRLVADPGPDPGSRQVFRALASRHRVMWRVLTGPPAPPAQERFQEAVAGIYDLRVNADYWGIGVQKWTRSPTWGARP